LRLARLAADEAENAAIATDFNKRMALMTGVKNLTMPQ